MTDTLQGKTFGQFEVGELIYTGGISEVYRAFQSTLQRTVAFRTLQPKYRNNDQYEQALTRGAQITVRAKSADARHVSIEVEDHGRGIDADDLPRIFEPFFTTRADGTGLGLAICHKVVRAHGGDIQVRSTPGAGSTFTIVLPSRREGVTND